MEFASSRRHRFSICEFMALAMQSEAVNIRVNQTDMAAMLARPEGCLGIVLFAHYSENHRIRPPNDYVASVLRSARLGTMWLDLLAPQEDGIRKSHVDVEMLVDRLDAACEWLLRHGTTRNLPLGLYGVGNGAAAALHLAAGRGGISALVSRGGYPGLAGSGALGRVNAPTLLIVGGLDDRVVAMNRTAYAALRCKKRFEIIPGATHFFEEPGSLEVVARLARGWFLQHSS